LNAKFALIFSTTLNYFSKKSVARYYKNVLLSSRKLPVILVRFKWNLNCFDRFSKNIQISTFMKIRPVEGDLFHAGGQTGMTKLTVAFRNILNVPNNWQYIINGL